MEFYKAGAQIKRNEFGYHSMITVGLLVKLVPKNKKKKMPGFAVLAILTAVLAVANTQLTEQEKVEMLDAHNVDRHKLNLPSAAEPDLEWNSILAKVAQDYSAKCTFAHNAKRKDEAVGYPNSVGENIYATTANEVKMASVVKSWYSEVENYHYSSNSCDPGKMCGHYTQVIWSTTTEVGCGMTKCDNIKGVDKAGILVVCDYGPSGNYVGQAPYRK